MNPDFINPLVLAYLGDSVLELLVREYLIKNDLQKVNELYQKATHYVSSKAHEDFILYILEQNFLTEKEVGIFKRGRNTSKCEIIWLYRSGSGVYYGRLWQM